MSVEIFPVNALCFCSKYKWQLHVSATKYPSTGCLSEKYKGNHVLAVYI